MSFPLENMNDDSFRKLEEQYQAVCNALGRKISAISTASGDNRQAIVNEAEGDVYEAEGILRKMGVEIRHYPYNLKSKCQSELQVLKASFESQKRDLNRAQRPAVTRGALGDKAQRNQRKRAQKEERQRLLGAKESVEESDASLIRTQQTIESTLETGAATSSQLVTQREQLLHAHEEVRETNAILFRARRLLQRMARRTVTNKLITAFIILVELAAIGLIAWKKKLI